MSDAQSARFGTLRAAARKAEGFAWRPQRRSAAERKRFWQRFFSRRPLGKMSFAGAGLSADRPGGGAGAVCADGKARQREGRAAKVRLQGFFKISLKTGLKKVYLCGMLYMNSHKNSRV